MHLQYLILVPMLCLSVGKVLLQGTISRTYLKNTTDTAWYNLIIFICMSVLYFVLSGFRLPSLHILPYGVIYGLMLTGFQLFYTLALQRGPVSHTTLITTFNLVFSISFGILYCGEEMTILHVIGLVCIFLSLLLTVDFKQAKQHKFDILWFVFSLIAMAMNGTASIVVKLQKLTYPAEDVGMLMTAYITGSLVLYLSICYFTHVRKEPRTMRLNNSRLILILSNGVLLGAFLLLYNIGAGLIPSVVFFPVVNIAHSTLIALLGIFAFKDKLTKQQMFSLFFGIAATILLCI